MKDRALFLLLGCSTFAFANVAQAQVAADAGAPVDAQSGVTDNAQDSVGPDRGDIVVTGSRVITNGNNSPTPITVVSAEQLQQTTPSNIPDALRKLPVFANSRNSATLGNASSNTVGNYLNLRGFGIIRTLILLDGHRVPSTNADGTVDTNTLPQLLMQRVDVVTGGASAVYGSDAVTGVVNFVLDKNFNGVKAQAQSGISQRGDASTWRAGFAAGTNLLGERGHFELSYEHFRQNGIEDKFEREAGRAVYSETGGGTAANPFRRTANTRVANATFGGLILSGPLANQQFVSNGVLGAFNPGTATGTNNIRSGGDGAYVSQSSLTASLETDQAFARFDYDLAEGINVYAQAAVARSENENRFAPILLNNVTISATNPFLSPAIRSALAGGPATFQFGRYINDRDGSITRARAVSLNATVGVDGKLGGFDWSLFYTRGHSRQRVENINNLHQGRLSAALDAVSSGGQAVCNVTLTNPSLYPGCVPLDPFGPTAGSDAAYDYVTDTTSFRLVNAMDDFGASISGRLFDTWAGPVRAAITGEYRHMTLENRSTVQPATRVDCTGLRFNCAVRSPTNNGTALYRGNVTADVNASQSVAEIAFEANVPLLRDVAFFRSLDVNGAVRYADYSISGGATTWKIGVDWHPTNDLSFRATRSRDFRAPTLNDLFAPAQESSTGFTDIHTNTAGITRVVSSGNPNLVPEVANTLTIGSVYKPAWLPGFSLAIDYFKIRIDNAITSIGGNSAATLAQCEASNGTSPLCELYVRPLPFADRSAANYPIRILTQSLNVAQSKTEGVDVEMNYVTELRGGRLSLRGFGTYQPVLSTVQFSGAPTINAAGAASQSGQLGQAKWRLSAFVSYATDMISIDVQERWRSSLKSSGDPLLVFADPKVPAAAYTDLNLTFHPGGNRERQIFFSVQNLFDKKAPVFISPAFASNPGFYYPAVTEDDVVGRYFTVGVRARF